MGVGGKFLPLPLLDLVRSDAPQHDSTIRTPAVDLSGRILHYQILNSVQLSFPPNGRFPPDLSCSNRQTGGQI